MTRKHPTQGPSKKNAPPQSGDHIPAQTDARATQPESSTKRGGRFSTDRDGPRGNEHETGVASASGGPRDGNYGTPRDPEPDSPGGGSRGIHETGSWSKSDDSMQHDESRSVGDAAIQQMPPDDRICLEIRNLLEVAEDVDADRIQVSADHGVVILEGTVQSEDVAGRVELLAGECKGLREIHNHLRVGNISRPHH